MRNTIYSESYYVNDILQNLEKMSRTVRDGIYDTSVSSKKPHSFLENKENLRSQATIKNIVECIKILCNKREADFKNFKVTELPVIIGSGITVKNINKYFLYSNAFIVGSHFKKEGRWYNELDKKRIIKFKKVFDSLK